MVGNAVDAQFILDWVSYNELDSFSLEEYGPGDVPEGWTYLSKGSFRSVWLSPEGCVYKVQHQYEGWGQSNKDEWRNILAAQRCEAPAGTRLPEAQLYQVDGGRTVIAMECIKGKTVDQRWGVGDTPREIGVRMRQVERAYELCDLHGDNVMIEDETDILIPVDLGY